MKKPLLSLFVMLVATTVHSEQAETTHNTATVELPPSTGTSSQFGSTEDGVIANSPDNDEISPPPSNKTANTRAIIDQQVPVANSIQPVTTPFDNQQQATETIQQTIQPAAACNN